MQFYTFTSEEGRRKRFAYGILLKGLTQKIRKLSSMR